MSDSINQVIRNCLAIASANERRKSQRECRVALSDYLSQSQIDILQRQNTRDECGEFLSWFSVETD